MEICGRVIFGPLKASERNSHIPKMGFIGAPEVHQTSDSVVRETRLYTGRSIRLAAKKGLLTFLHNCKVMPLIKLTAKRQATLPKSLCEELRIEPGDSLLVVKKVFDGEAFWCLQPLRETSAPPWLGALKKFATGKSHDLEDIRDSVERVRRDVR